MDKVDETYLRSLARSEADILQSVPEGQEQSWQKTVPTSATNEQDRPRRRQLRVVSASRWQDRVAPEREWIVEGLIPRGEVTLLFGDGGTGKSTLVLQLMTAMALDEPFLGLQAKKGKSMGLFCEDGENELHRRQTDINAYYGVTPNQVGKSHPISRVGEDNVLMQFSGDGSSNTTWLLSQIRMEVGRLRPLLIVIDTLSDTFGGNENIRSHARQFIQELASLCKRYGTTILLLAHPSKDGLNSGAGSSGSTGWSNTVRSRLYLRESQDNPNVRFLTCKKANYSAKGNAIKLIYENGAFIRINASNDIEDLAAVKAAFLFLLNKCETANTNVSDSKRGNYAPRVFVKHGKSCGYSFKISQYEQVMSLLLMEGVIKLENMNSGRSKRLVVVEKLCFEHQLSTEGPS